MKVFPDPRQRCEILNVYWFSISAVESFVMWLQIIEKPGQMQIL